MLPPHPAGPARRPSSAAMAPALLPLLLVALVGVPTRGLAATLAFDFHHRFSPRVREWVESRSWQGGRARVWEWPEEGSVEYYAALAEHDRVFRGRGLAAADPPLTFFSGNATIRLSGLGFLHYAVASVGTPSTDYLVALDTGSDLFWVPCDCQQCASTSAQSFGLEGIEFNIYSPSSSTTSKTLPCSSALCDLRSQCTSLDDPCPYVVQYVSENTSSSGVLVQDVLHLVKDDSHNETVDAKVILGCGKFQTGSFLDSAAVNGLFGLGMEKISVPSTLSSSGIAADSFSMCFGLNGIGRIRFGDKGSSDQYETPLNVYGSHPTYNVTVTGVRVGNSSMSEDFNAVVDSGTSFTYLADPAYTRLTEHFNSKIEDQRHTPSSNLPFEYCYVPRFNESIIPTIGLKMHGGSEFPVTRPIIIVSSQLQPFYCLALVKTRRINIIGQNFMSGLRIVFDREKKALGWKKFNCSDVEDSNTLPVTPTRAGAPAPAYSGSPGSYNPEATATRNSSITKIPVRPTSSSYSVSPTSFRQSLLLLIILAACL